MDAVNKVIEAGKKAIWGKQSTNTANSQTTAGSSQPTTSTGMTGIQSVDKVVEAGKKAIWGDSTEQQTSHGEEPVAGKMGLGTATDPYDAGNRDEQYNAPPVEASGLPTSIPVSEQRNIETTETSLNTANKGTGSGIAVTGTAAATQYLKTTVTGLRPDPGPPGNAPDSISRAIPDGGPGQTLKHTFEPFEEETQKLVKDLQDKVDEEKPKIHTQAGGVAVSRPNQAVHSKEDNPVSSSPGSSAGEVDNQGQEQKSKTSWDYDTNVMV
uniref:3-deoxy-manno-octulosonate cytidylyltransferase n=1 Tax=Talaromyces marneffei PM1 TaxID=1077442 RepID=A0A093VHN8_TALMA